MSKPIILVDNVQKIYKIPIREPGLRAAFISLFHPVYQQVPAVDGINFKIEPGEIVGLIGPNGAGKTTTLKMLAGVLYPTSGVIKVIDYIPWERKSEYLKKISIVFGNKSQLSFENTVYDSFEILGEIYHVSKPDFKKYIDELIDLLELESLLPKLVRNLSLGERSKCELAAALIHQPRVLFLDEPTLGLDVTMQLRIRKFVADYAKTNGTTAIITSHYMADILSLCPRVILIHHGKVLFDGELEKLSAKIAPFKIINLNVDNHQKLEAIVARLPETVIVTNNDRNYTIRIKKESTSRVVSELLNELHIDDLTIEDPPLENVMDQVYREGM